MLDTGSYYVINHLVLFTGLTDRTIRSYIASGILEGEKINGLWHFTPEQVEAFVRHPAVRPSILAKHNALVYDFLLDNRKESSEVCVILDVPGADRKQLAEFFCDRITGGNFRSIRFSYDGVTEVPRIILKGEAGAVLALASEYTNRNAGTNAADR